MNDSHWLKTLQINDSVDIYDNNQYVKLWCYGKIIQINNQENTVKVAFYGWSTTHAVWVKKDDNKMLAPFNTHTPLCIMMTPPLSTIHDETLHLSRFCKTQQNKENYILFQKTAESNITKYIVKTNKYKHNNIDIM